MGTMAGVKSTREKQSLAKQSLANQSLAKQSLSKSAGTKAPRTAAQLLGLRPKAVNARDRLIHTTIDLCYRQGFNAVGLDQIIAATGVTKTTFYKHFESKDALLIAAITTRNHWENQAWMRATRRHAGKDPKAQLLGFVDVLDQWFNVEDFGGCLFINAASEFPNPNDPIHQAAAQHKHETYQWYLSLAQKAGARDASAFTDQYALLLEGALIMRQVLGRNDAARLARQMVVSLMAQHMPEPALV